jgi:putative heme-binding domain-containing protein
MIWFAIEPLVAGNPGRALELAKSSKIPMVTEYIARRAVDANELEMLLTAVEERSDARLALLTGMRAGLEGQLDVTPPGNWDAIYARLQADDSVADLAQTISQQFGGIGAAKQFMTTLKDDNADTEARRRALNGLARQQNEVLIKELPGLLRNPDLRIEAIRAVAAFNLPKKMGALLMEEYDSFSSAEKLEVVQVLASRTDYGRILMYALRENRIPKRDVPAYVARQMRRVVGSGFLEVWGPLNQLSAEKAAANAKYKALLNVEALTSADARKGREMYDSQCGVCHKMYGSGGILGPDITGSNRTNIDYLLSNILDPSAEIQDDYKIVMVTTRDGRTYVGNIASENERTLTLRVVGQDSVLISKSNIQSREGSELSMMPEGIFANLTDQEVLNLVAYLTTARKEDH